MNPTFTHHPSITGTWYLARGVGSPIGRFLMWRAGFHPIAKFAADGTFIWNNNKNPDQPVWRGTYEFSEARTVALYYYERDGARYLLGTIQDYREIGDGVMHIKIPGCGTGGAAWEFKRQ